MRFNVPDSTKYFCQSEAFAYYLQKYVVYRKRKIYVGDRDFKSLESIFQKFENESFLLPTSDILNSQISSFLASININWTSAQLYKTVVSALSDLRDVNYDILSVSIAHSCTGFQSVGIFISAYISYIFNTTKEINLYMISLLIIGVLASYLANLLRMFVIILAGYFWGGNILYYTHQNIGGLIFLLWISIFWYFLDRYLLKNENKSNS